ncbi:MAG: methyltransferase domain-containing protein [Sphingomonadales bacterium]|nr:methyltransferase domain-containing protein [Sphingomonadales bacterium]
MADAPPRIFAPARRIAARRRMMSARRLPEAPTYLLDDMVDDVIDRLGFLRVTPRRALVIGDQGRGLEQWLVAQGAEVTAAEPATGHDDECPLRTGGFDFIASLGVLDTVNDLPGALLHLRAALAPGGLMIASFIAAGSLPQLRAALLAADGDRPAARIHPMVDVRAGGQLLQRAGFADPVVDSRTLQVRFGSLDRLVADLRAQGLGSVLASPAPPLTRSRHAIARAAFASAGEGGRTTERFEILTLSGWRAT